jgi:LuxR family maltose regulon positive regulatory protein
MPKSVLYLLTWSSSQQTYKMYEGKGNEALDLIPGSRTWLAWVNQLSSFAFHGRNGFYTVRKEYRRGTGYWYAYVRIEGKLTKRYVGKSTELTLDGLERLAQEIWASPQSIVSQDEGTSRSQLPSGGSFEGSIYLPDGIPDVLSDTDTASSALERLDIESIPLHEGANGQNGLTTPEDTEKQQVEVLSKIFHLSTDALLTTKLLVPRLLAHLVHRSRLIQRLQQGLHHKLMLISAPAGFGKSTLLADWLASRTFPVAWLSLDPQDNDPARFFPYLLAALQIGEPRLRKAIQDLLYASPTTSLEGMLTALINTLQLYKSDDQQPLVVVLDDYHVISDTTIHHVLSYLVEHLPSYVCLVISTRKDPPLPLARLRGQDDLLELRATDLQFTPEETAMFLVEVMELPLSAEECSLLHARTEGWIIGLHLAVLSLLDHEDRTAFIAAFNGSHHYVMDYLLEEALNQQDLDIQDFLMQTSILDQFSAPLCDAVRERSGSQHVLDFIERSNLFLVALDDERRWYRYHHLFAQMLRQVLHQATPELVPQLHLRASHWYEQNGFLAEAVSHGLAASAFEEVAQLLEQHIESFLSGDQLPGLARWLKALPEALFLTHPALGLIHALVLMYTNHPDAAAVWLHMLEPESLLKGQVLAAWGILTRLAGDLEHCVVFSRQALALLPQTESAPLTRLLRMEAMYGASHAYLVSGDVTAANEHRLTELVAFTSTLTDYQFLTPRNLKLLARFQRLQGQLRKAAMTYEESAQLFPETRTLLASADGAAYYFGRGALLYEWNELEAAERALRQGMQLLKDAALVDADTVWLGYATMTRLHMARGEYSQALAMLDAFRQLAQHRRLAPILLMNCSYLYVQVQLARGEPQVARQWVERYAPSATDAPQYLHEQKYLMLAYVYLAASSSANEKELAQVRAFLELLHTQAEASMRMYSTLDCLTLLALVHERQGDHAGALTLLDKALTQAEPEGYVRLFLDKGAPMLALLRVAQRHHLAPHYVEQLLHAVGETEKGKAAQHTRQPAQLLEPLTARESDVLALLLDGLSNREIAQQLTVSVNTVKKHVRNICGKLNVQGRTHVIAKAQRFGLQ